MDCLALRQFVPAAAHWEAVISMSGFETLVVKVAPVHEVEPGIKWSLQFWYVLTIQCFLGLTFFDVWLNRTRGRCDIFLKGIAKVAGM